MANAVVLTHADFEGPARVADILREQDIALEVRRLHRGDPVPRAVDRRAILVVMGGSMGVGDRDRPGFPYLRQEIELLRDRIRDRAPTLGVCLGAQLLAHAAGADVFAMRERDPNGVRYEIGWADVRFATTAGAPVPEVLDGLPPRGPVLHWHGDSFDLPPGAVRLASTDGCPEQAFQLHERLFGLQFHAEVGLAEVEAFLRHDADFVLEANGPDGVERIRRDTARWFDVYAPLGDRLLRNIIREMRKP